MKGDRIEYPGGVYVARRDPEVQFYGWDDPVLAVKFTHTLTPELMDQVWDTWLSERLNVINEAEIEEVRKELRERNPADVFPPPLPRPTFDWWHVVPARPDDYEGHGFYIWERQKPGAGGAFPVVMFQ